MIPTIQCFEKCKTMETVRRSVMVRDKMERWGGWMNKWITEALRGNETSLYDTTMFICVC